MREGMDLIGWSRQEKKWLPVSVYHQHYDMHRAGGADGYYPTMLEAQLANGEPVMFDVNTGSFPIRCSTGLKDASGVRIYEGDIGQTVIDGKQYIGYIRYYAGKWLFDLRTPYEKTFYRGYDLTDIFEGKFASNGDHPCEVIGNIYENEELLKEVVDER